MPRKSRIDAPGALHHIIVRGIERSDIFKDDIDRNNFKDRLGGIVQETRTSCFAWALIPNHFHLLLKTGAVPIATLMRRLLTGYAVTFNRRHHRAGHLFQNRYKSILCQQEPYLLELIRYIHLNPIRAGLVKDMNALGRYAFSGHSILMGKVNNDWQDTSWVLKLYDQRVPIARRKYRLFVQKGMDQGRRDDLTGGGLIRSSGGWTAIKALRRANLFQKSDERILGNGDFVEQVIANAEEQMKERYDLIAKGYDIDKIASKVSEIIKIDPTDILTPGKEPMRVKARSLLCYWAVSELGVSLSDLSRRCNLSLSGVSLSVKRGETIAKSERVSLI